MNDDITQIGGTTFNGLGFLYGFVLLLFAVLVLLIYYLPVQMANKRGRNAFGWFVFSILFSPILSIVILFLLDETDEKRRERIMEEEKIRAYFRRLESLQE